MNYFLQFLFALFLSSVTALEQAEILHKIAAQHYNELARIANEKLDAQVAARKAAPNLAKATAILHKPAVSLAEHDMIETAREHLLQLDAEKQFNTLSQTSSTSVCTMWGCNGKLGVAFFIFIFLLVGSAALLIYTLTTSNDIGQNRLLVRSFSGGAFTLAFIGAIVFGSYTKRNVVLVHHGHGLGHGHW